MTLGRKTALYLAVVVILLWSLLPLVWMLVVALLPADNLNSRPVNLDLSKLDLGGFAARFGDGSFRNAMLHSFIIASATTLACLLIGSLAGYSLARIRFSGKSLFMGAALATQMIPGVILLIPIFLVFRQLGLTDSMLGLVLLYSAFLLPYSIWLLRGFFEEVPIALEQAARLDGCSRVGALFRIIIPVAAPGLAATAIFLYISTWNEFLFALVLTLQNSKTATVALAEIQGQIFGAQDYTALATAAVLVILPPVLIAVLLNRYLVRSLAESAVKG